MYFFVDFEDFSNILPFWLKTSKKTDHGCNPQVILDLLTPLADYNDNFLNIKILWPPFCRPCSVLCFYISLLRVRHFHGVRPWVRLSQRTSCGHIPNSFNTFKLRFLFSRVSLYSNPQKSSLLSVPRSVQTPEKA